jgi:hypothetical protein
MSKDSKEVAEALRAPRRDNRDGGAVDRGYQGPTDSRSMVISGAPKP